MWKGRKKIFFVTVEVFEADLKAHTRHALLRRGEGHGPPRGLVAAREGGTEGMRDGGRRWREGREGEKQTRTARLGGESPGRPSEVRWPFSFCNFKMCSLTFLLQHDSLFFFLIRIMIYVREKGKGFLYGLNFFIAFFYWLSSRSKNKEPTTGVAAD